MCVYASVNDERVLISVCVCLHACRYSIYVNHTDLLWRVGYVGAAYVSMIVVVRGVNGVR